MRRAARFAALLVATLAALHPAPPARALLQLRVPMRDGIALSANVFLPASPGPFPTLLVRTPYGKGDSLLPTWQGFVDRGYAVVVQDVRGRSRSGGAFTTVAQETPDGYDTLDWIVRQPWSTGSVGMLGGSYLGITQWRAALSGHPALKAIVPVVSGFDEYRDRFYSPGGALKLGHRLLWLAENMRRPGVFFSDFSLYTRVLPLRDADRAATGQTVPLWQEALRHPSFDDHWRRLSTREHSARLRTPAFIVGGWYDNYVQSDVDAYTTLRRQGVPARLLIGPWPHSMAHRFAGVDFGPAAAALIRRLQLDWYAAWLTPTIRPTAADAAPVRLFVMGANQWRDEPEWPLDRAVPTPLFLGSSGRANTLSGDGTLSFAQPTRVVPDQFLYDPRDPVPTRGGAVCCNPAVFPWGPLDQREVERRRDVLVYTSAPLVQDLEVTGPVRAVLYVRTTAPDTDFTAKLVDVFPGGHARLLTDGILRLRYRRGLSRPELARPGALYPITIELGVTSNLFRPGHRIRLEVSSSNFPRFDRNPNTGRPLAEESQFRAALQTIYHDRQRPAHLLLPVVGARRRW